MTTTSGRVEGTTHEGIHVFRGIPYAAPPDGPLRFEAPAPPRAWNGVRPAFTFGAAPPQAAMIPGTPPPWEPEDGMDCLTANVWSPDLGASGLPVMVWIYGGAWRFGRADEPLYDGANLARDGVVVVSFNYRVGFEGLGHVPGAPQNRMLLDQIAALEWVRDNIAAFGGDPAKVTIFGESAGGTSVATLLATPRTEGLFRRAIGQSIAGRPLPPADARRVTAMVAEAADVPATAEGLRSLSPHELLSVQDTPLASIEGDDTWSFNDAVTCYAPVLDGDLITDTPWAILRKGARRDVDLVAGYTTDEFQMFALMRQGPVDVHKTALRIGLDAAAVDAYRAAYPALDDAGVPTVMCSDMLFRMPTTWVAEAHAAAGGRTFLYEFAWRSPAMGGAMGAGHGVDVPFTFGNTDGAFAGMVLGTPEPEQFAGLSREIRTAWTSFAITGDPGWPAFTPVGGKVRMWDVPSRVDTDPQSASRAIWRAVSGL